MPFKPTSLPDQIAAARRSERQTIHSQPTTFSGGAAQRAKESSARWTQAGIRDPERDAAPPPFSGMQPFSAQRQANSRNFDDWKSRFTGETDMGWKFVPPPPEPAATPAVASDSTNSKAKPGQEVA